MIYDSSLVDDFTTGVSLYLTNITKEKVAAMKPIPEKIAVVTASGWCHSVHTIGSAIQPTILFVINKFDIFNSINMYLFVFRLEHIHVYILHTFRN